MPSVSRVWTLDSMLCLQHYRRIVVCYDMYNLFLRRQLPSSSKPLITLGLVKWPVVGTVFSAKYNLYYTT